MASFVYALRNSASACVGTVDWIFARMWVTLCCQNKGSTQHGTWQKFDKCHDEIMSKILPRLKQDLGGLNKWWHTVGDSVTEESVLFACCTTTYWLHSAPSALRCWICPFGHSHTLQAKCPRGNQKILKTRNAVTSSQMWRSVQLQLVHLRRAAPREATGHGYFNNDFSMLCIFPVPTIIAPHFWKPIFEFAFARYQFVISQRHEKR